MSYRDISLVSQRLEVQHVGVGEPDIGELRAERVGQRLEFVRDLVQPVPPQRFVGGLVVRDRRRRRHALLGRLDLVRQGPPQVAVRARVGDQPLTLAVGLLCRKQLVSVGAVEVNVLRRLVLELVDDLGGNAVLQGAHDYFHPVALVGVLVRVVREVFAVGIVRALHELHALVFDGGSETCGA
ncbi:elongation factor Ts [Babesia caballi]|uniref:Elongation factor Ts n=1 Tax=Babesia caballi TaxID=5871 RepID=A0AAV4LUF9_BABCB|nr:elongation factor Ts [Babesia caballi]